jgi:hypothetical protein
MTGETTQKNNPNEKKAFSSLKIPDFSQKVFEKTPTQKKVVIVKKAAPVDYSFRAMLFLILSFALLFGVYFVYNYALDFLETKEKASEKSFVFENPLVRGDRSRVVSLEAGSAKETVRSVLVQTLKNERVGDGELAIITPSYLRDTLVNGERKLVSEPQRGDDFFFTFAVRSPLNLRAIAGDKYAIGTAGVGNVKEEGSKNFFAFSVNSPADANREMLRYESQIYFDMKEVLKLRDIKGDFQFKDLGDNNHILRVGYDDDGVVLVYGFAAPRTILVTPDTQTFDFVYKHLK